MGWQDAPTVDSGDAQPAWKQAPTVSAEPSREDIQKATLVRMISPIPGLGVDVVEGAKRGVDAIAQGIAHIPGMPDSFKQFVDSHINQDKAEYEQKTLPGVMYGTGAGVGRAVGGAALAAPAAIPAGAGVAATLAGAAGNGAISGVLDPVYGDTSNYWTDKAKQAGTGAAAGAALGAASKIAGKVVGGANVSPQTQTLIDADVRLTPGQIAGGAAKATEDKLMSAPLIGDLIGKRRFEGVTDFNRAVYARAVEPLSQFDPAASQVAAKADVGNAGIKAVGDYLSSKYDDALSKSVPSPFDSQLQQELTKLSGMVPASKRNDFVDVIKSALVDKLTPTGTIAPSVAKDAESQLGSLARGYTSSQDFEQRRLGYALREAQSSLRDAFARYNPNTAPVISATNAGWATLVQLEKAANSAGARKDGIFTPAQYIAAVSSTGGGGVRNRAMSRGDKLNQDLAQAGAQVLPSQVADSGTTARLLTNALAGEGLKGAGMLFDPHTWAAAGTAALPYLPGIGPKLTSLAMLARPQAGRDLGQLLQQIAPYTGLLAGASGP